MRRRWASALAVLTVVGCGGPPGPRTYTATGKVVFSDGQPLTGGMVQFQPQNDAGASVMGEVGKDGAFSLYTLVDGQKKSGAVEGAYRVLIVPLIGADQSVRPVTLPEVYTVKKEGNEFTLTIPRSP